MSYQYCHYCEFVTIVN